MSRQFYSSKEKRAIGILTVLYTVGISAVALGYESVLRLTPLNLLISLAVVWWFHPHLERRMVLWAGIVFFASFIVEWAGIRTGKIFGQYFYGENLGIKLYDVPLMIGINWVMLSYVSMQTVHTMLKKYSLPNTELVYAFFGAVLMVVIDILMEAVCGRMDFWYWKNQVPPMQNYTAWFTFAFCFNFLYTKLHLPAGNKVAVWLFGLQFIFFLCMNIIFSIR